MSDLSGLRETKPGTSSVFIVTVYCSVSPLIHMMPLVSRSEIIPIILSFLKIAVPLM
ncbi:hypothetical protein D3C73_903620 [compost metagenome]